MVTPVFAAPYAPDDESVVPALLEVAAPASPAAEARIDARARDLIGAVRGRSGGLGAVESLLREYALTTAEGLALMVLAEALLRVPDAATADRLIEDKLGQGGFLSHATRSRDPIVGATTWALGLSSRIVRPGETPDGTLAGLARRIGLPAVRHAARQAMHLMGDHFVLGETIGAALRRAQRDASSRHRYSYDMLGEGARTAADAASYRDAYAAAIEAIGRSAGDRRLPERPGISVKLSALHPRYEPLARDRVLAELPPVLLDLARRAKHFDLAFTVDAEEADRLELSLDVVGRVLADRTLAGWDGFGLAVQAYQKRCLAVVDHVATLAKALDRRLMVRLVKGAYWDTEVKRAQVRGLGDFPVFTRKPATDLAYLAAAAKLLAYRPALFPQFATHNALTVANLVEQAGGGAGYEFQRLHGMGEALYARLLETLPDAACRIYAPVGGHRDLLAYLVRRLLENGASSSFVWQAADPDVPIDDLLRRPQARLREAGSPRHPRIVRPPDLYAPTRRNAAGVEYGDRAAFDRLLEEIATRRETAAATSIVDGTPDRSATLATRSPVDGSAIGTVVAASPALADAAVVAARRGANAWARTPAADRAAALDRAADAIEGLRGRLIHLLQVEGGKSLDDAVSEVREAADFCRYYAAEARRLFTAPIVLPGPTGEDNRLGLRPRGVFVAISPWNFPLAIFLGQVAAALAAGNAVVAKPAEQTMLIAAETTRLLHDAGIPPSALHLVLGDGAIGARLAAHPAIDGVVFTGSTEVARAINRTLAAKDGPIVPLIAETGGINAMIVDATALPEQVADDVVASAFRSAGQRCSALRLLVLQEDVADRMLAMIEGAARELTVGDPRDASVDVGPLIDAPAKAAVVEYLREAAERHRVRCVGAAPRGGTFVVPHIVELDDARRLTCEIFGPVLHVARYAAENLDSVLEAVAATGYALTLGVHSRVEATLARVLARMPTGNVYVNRSMIGAVVGTQPFGGSGLSGTGPKAGGPNYLARFAIEQTVSVNTAAAGGNAALATLSDA